MVNWNQVGSNIAKAKLLSKRDRPYDCDTPEGAILYRHGLDYPPCGFSVGPGWLGLVDATLGLLREHGWTGKVGQVKEKFGGLRLYFGCSPGDSVEDSKRWIAMVDDAEAKSFTICDVCGDEGKKRNRNGWLMTRCEAHNTNE